MANEATELSPAEQAIKNVVSEMTPELRKVVNEIDSRLAREAGGTLLVFHDIGTMVRNVLADATKYGDNAVELLAKRFNKSTSYFYNRRNFAKMYTRDEVKKLAARPMSNGNYLTPSHMEYLITVGRAADRNKLLERVITESMSAERLNQEIAANGVEKSNKRFGGRKPKKPATPLIAAQQVSQRFSGMTNLLPVWKESLVDAIEEMEPEKAANPVLLEKLNEAVQRAEDFEGELTNLLDGLRKNVKRVDEIVKARKKEVAEAEKQNKKEEVQITGRRPARTAKA